MINQTILDESCSYLKKVFKNKIQELILEHCTDEHGDYIKLVNIQIKKSCTNKGYGQLILSEIIRLADDHNVRIRLWATNIYGSDLKRLKAFYYRNGFTIDEDKYMTYRPQKTLDSFN